MTLISGADIERIVLLQPIADGLTELSVLSGFASPNMLASVLATDGGSHIRIRLIVGMVGAQGISVGAHQGFMNLVRYHRRRVGVSYVIGDPVHSKVYVWSSADGPKRAYVGSSNFSSNGLQHGYEELLTPADPADCLAYINHYAAAALPCDDPALPPELIVLPSPVARIRGVTPGNRPWQAANAPFVDISLLTSRTPTGVAYGLNWGQREGRDPDQSYLPVPAQVARSGFLPRRGLRFTLLAPDGQALSVVVAQDGDKAIETPESNAILGRFIRDELGVPHGSAISRATLEEAGATSYRLYRVDEETYAVEFRGT